MQVAYFGCWDEVGHGLYDIYGQTIVRNQLIGFPWSLFGKDIDGLLCPDNDQKEGEVKINVGENSGVTPGMQLDILDSDLTGAGKIVVTSVGPKASKAKVLEKPEKLAVGAKVREVR